MSSRRFVILFIAALLVIAGAVWLSSQRHLDRATMAGQLLLPDLKSALIDVTEVRIIKSGGDHTTLKKRGADWIVNERDFMADVGKLRKLLIALSTLQVVEEKTSNPRLYGALDLQDVPAAGSSATRIDVVTPKRTWSLIAGKSSGAKHVYVRPAEGKQSFLASPRLDADSEPQRWLEHTIIDIPEARIQSVAMQPAKGPAYAASREKKEQENFTVSNIPGKRKLSSAGSGNTLARGLEAVSLEDLRNKADVPAPPPANTTVESAHATYRTFDGLTIEVSGRKESAPGLQQDAPKVEKRFISLTASADQKATAAEAQKLTARTTGKEFEISSYKYDAMFKPVEDLLEAPATPQKN